jgi:hypothetical protein
LRHTFILNGIGFDYLALSWENLEKVANLELNFVSMITEGKILCNRSPGKRNMRVLD